MPDSMGPLPPLFHNFLHFRRKPSSSGNWSARSTSPCSDLEVRVGSQSGRLPRLWNKPSGCCSKTARPSSEKRSSVVVVFRFGVIGLGFQDTRRESQEGFFDVLAGFRAGFKYGPS